MQDDNTTTELLDAARAFRARVVECEEHPSMRGLYQMGAIRGMFYSGPNWIEELKRLDEAIVKAEARS